jgi:hypothetical protein
MKALTITSLIALLYTALLLWLAEDADAHYYDRCKKWRCKVHVIQPFKTNFLGPVGACESGTGSHNLKVGLKALSATGQYRGRYQFGMPDWQRAGGKGDPRSWGWIEQGYRAVVWLHRNGRKSWPNC